MTLKQGFVETQKGQGGQGVFLALQLGKKFRSDLFRFFAVKGRMSDHVMDQLQAWLKEAGQKVGFQAEGVFSVKAGNTAGHISNFDRQLAIGQVGGALR